jgi:very-short-patch-repair endonuclease
MPAPTPLPQLLVGRSFALQEASSSLSRRRSQATDLSAAHHQTGNDDGGSPVRRRRSPSPSDGDEVCLAEGLPCTTPARTWLDLASVLTLDDLVAAGDSIICAHQRSFEPERPPLALPTALARTVAAHRGARGVATAREALQLLRVGSDSPPETLLRLELVRARLPEPELNVVIRDSLGKDVAWPDLAYRKYRIAIQYDGAHHLSPDQQESDARRDRGTMLAGWIPIIVTSALLEDVGYSGVVSMIRGALLSRGWNPSD